MCYGHRRRSLSPTRNNNALAVDTLRVRLAETEARLERARAREAELTRRLEEMKRFVSVMEILESYLKQRAKSYSLIECLSCGNQLSEKKREKRKVDSEVWCLLHFNFRYVHRYICTGFRIFDFVCSKSSDSDPSRGCDRLIQCFCNFQSSGSCCQSHQWRPAPWLIFRIRGLFGCTIRSRVLRTSKISRNVYYM
ncbi:hypothetical protein V6N13_126874 [Hibiscus sabdariffa]